MKRKILLLAALPVIAIPGCDSNPIKGKPDYSKYANTNIATVSGMIAPPRIYDEKYATKSQINQEQYDQLKRLGFNTVIAMYECDDDKDDTRYLQDILNSIKYAKNAGINILLKAALYIMERIKHLHQVILQMLKL